MLQKRMENHILKAVDNVTVNRSRSYSEPSGFLVPITYWGNAFILPCVSSGMYSEER